MTTGLLLAVMVGLALGSVITAGVYEMRNRARTRRERRLSSLLEDDLYPYYPTPKLPPKEGTDAKMRDI